MLDSSFVEDGPERALKGASDQVAALTEQTQLQVESEYAAQIANAGRLRRTYLRFRVRREVKRRIAVELEKIAPTGGLYMTQ